MPDDKCRFSLVRSFIILVIFMDGVDLLEESFICGSWKTVNEITL